MRPNADSDPTSLNANIHAPPEHGDQRNFHPHLAFSLRPMRRVEPYSWEVADEVCGALDGRGGVQALRHLWAHSMSEGAEQALRDMRYTGLGYGARGLDLETCEHLGEGRAAMVARGTRVWAHERNRITNACNAARLAIRDADRKIAALPYPTNTMTLGIVDTETTGLDPAHHEMIELALAKLVIDLPSGHVTDVAEPLSWLEQPGEPLTPEIEALTGICDHDLAGQRFPDEIIAHAFDDVDLVVAHNARFDAGFMTRRFPKLGHPWSCSASEVDWAAHGLGHGRSVGALVTAAGHYMVDAHRAAADAWAVTCLLAMRTTDGRAIAAHLIEFARRNAQRVYATNAPYRVKDVLKDAGYRWQPGRGWWLENEPERIANEAAWLASLDPAIRPAVVEIDWFNRHLM